MDERGRFSVIIPTLWRSERIFPLIRSLQRCPSVGEIILIDNSNQFDELFTGSLRKLVVLAQKKNLYVNPAWNLGVAKARFENVALVNDDVNFSCRLFDLVSPEVLENGIVGMEGGNYNRRKFVGPAHVGKSVGRHYGWGCIILFKKKDWIDIPKGLKIWYGDDWIHNSNPAKKQTLYHFPIQTDISTTAKDPSFNSIKHQDGVNYEKCQRAAARRVRLP